MTTEATTDHVDEPPGWRDAVLDALRQVWDPELGIDIVELGLVYAIRIGGAAIEIDMTLTTPGCPVSEQLPQEAFAAVSAAVPEASVDINVVWDPPWSPERMSPLAVGQLRFPHR